MKLATEVVIEQLALQCYLCGHKFSPNPNSLLVIPRGTRITHADGACPKCHHHDLLILLEVEPGEIPPPPPSPRDVTWTNA